MSLFSLLKFITNHPVNRNQKISSIIRFVKWQLSSRLAPGAILYKWIDDSRFIVYSGETGLTGNIYTGLHEFYDMGYLLHVLRPEDIFIDIGANVGSYSILAGAVIGTQGYAFEPVPKTFERLVENIRINKLEEKFSLFNVGLADRHEVLKFTSILNTVNHVVTSEEFVKDYIEVEVTTLDSIIAEVSPCLIKIDVEGYETPVLEGAKKILTKKSLHSIIVELNGSGEKYGFDESKLVLLLSDFGFRPFTYNPENRKLTEVEFKNFANGNTIFIRDEKFVLERIRHAKTFNIFGNEY